MLEGAGRIDEVPSGSRYSVSFRVALVLTALAGFGIRAFNILTVQSARTSSIDDAFLFYWWPAQQLAKGRGYISPVTLNMCTWKPTEISPRELLDLPDHLYNLCQAIPSAKHPPGFVTFLAGLDRLGISSMTAQRYALSLLGCVTVILLGMIAAKIISERAGIIAAGIAAVYPNIWISDTGLYAETLMSFGFVLGLFGVYAFWRNATWKNLLLASLGFAIATSARSEMVLLFVVIIVPLVLARRFLSFQRRLALLALAALAPLLIIVPWSMYNSGRFQHSVLLSTGLGPTMLASTCHQVYYSERIGLYNLACSKAPESLLRSGAWLDESVANDYSKRRAIDYAKAHPRRTALVVVAREGRMLDLWNPSQQNAFNSYAQGRGSLALVTTAQWMFWVLALSSIAGAVLWRRRRIPLYPLVAELVLTALVVAVTFGSTRYRAAAEWCLILLAATALDALVGWIWGRRRKVGAVKVQGTHSVDTGSGDPDRPPIAVSPR